MLLNRFMYSKFILFVHATAPVLLGLSMWICPSLPFATYPFIAWTGFVICSMWYNISGTVFTRKQFLADLVMQGAKEMEVLLLCCSPVCLLGWRECQYTVLPRELQNRKQLGEPQLPVCHRIP